MSGKGPKPGLRRSGIRKSGWGAQNPTRVLMSSTSPRTAGLRGMAIGRVPGDPHGGQIGRELAHVEADARLAAAALEVERRGALVGCAHVRGTGGRKREGPGEDALTRVEEDQRVVVDLRVVRRVERGDADVVRDAAHREGLERRRLLQHGAPGRPARLHELTDGRGGRGREIRRHEAEALGADAREGAERHGVVDGPLRGALHDGAIGEAGNPDVETVRARGTSPRPPCGRPHAARSRSAPPSRPGSPRGRRSSSRPPVRRIR